MANRHAPSDAAERDRHIPDIDWRSMPPGTVRDHVEAPSGRLARIRLGEPDAPRVVLVPGVTGSKEDFVLMLPELAAAGYRVEAIDMAGQYESASAGPENLVPPRESYDYRLFADDLIAVLESGPAPAHLLGYSFAGTVAQLVALERSDLVASLTLLSCPPLPGQSFRGVKRLGPYTHLTTGRVGAALMIWGIRRNFTRVSARRLEFVKSRFALTRRQSVRDIIELMMQVPDLHRELKASGHPKLVAVGEHDVWPVGLHREFAHLIGARMAVYRTGHSPCETSPYQLCRDMLALFEQTRLTPTGDRPRR